MSQISANEIQVKVLEFRGLIKTQPQLPQMIGKLLQSFNNVCN